MSKRYTKEWAAKIVKTRKERDNYKISDEHKEKISRANKGKKPTPETIEKIRLIRTGKTTSLLGRKFTEEHKRNIAESHKGLNLKETTKIKIALRENCAKGSKHGRAIITEEIALEIFKLYNSGLITQMELAKQYNVSRGVIIGIIYGTNWNHVTGLPLKGRKYKKE
ncbi:MAG TPA: hypothetical protein DEP72_06375 [Clostridiales bacterium]|nr:hypothetical protein [Clostridiales bacterium]